VLVVREVGASPEEDDLEEEDELEEEELEEVEIVSAVERGR
jgi:hypothetical protein